MICCIFRRESNLALRWIIISSMSSSGTSSRFRKLEIGLAGSLNVTLVLPLVTDALLPNAPCLPDDWVRWLVPSHFLCVCLVDLPPLISDLPDLFSLEFLLSSIVVLFAI